MKKRYVFNLFPVLVITSLLISMGSALGAQTASALGIVGTIEHDGFLPEALALDETRNRLFVFDKATSDIFIYNATTLQELGSVPTTLGNSVSMVVDESQGKLYAGYFGPGVSGANWIAVVNTGTGSLIKYLASGGYTQLVKDEALDLVYASSIAGISRINVATDAQTPVTGITGNLYTSMAVNRTTHELFVANWSQNDGKLFIVNPSTLAITPVANMAGFGVAVNWTENKAYVTYCVSAGFEGVCIHDRDSGTTKLVHTNNDSSYPLVFNPQVNRLYSDTEVNAIATIFNGSQDTFRNIPLSSALITVGVRYSTDNVYYANQSGTHVMIGATGQIVKNFPFPASCSLCQSAIVIAQTSGRVYVVNEMTAGAVTVIQDEDLILPHKVASMPAADGWILESSETSNQGSSVEATATTFRLGDNAANRQYRGILSFNTAGLPDNAVIIKVTLKIKRQSIVGTNPFTTHGKIAVDIRKGAFSNNAALQSTDFQAAASKPAVGLFANNPTAAGWYVSNLKAAAYPFINRTGITPFRLGFQTDDDNDAVADILKFHSGNSTAANRPVLVIEYYVP